MIEAPRSVIEVSRSTSPGRQVALAAALLLSLSAPGFGQTASGPPEPPAKSAAIAPAGKASPKIKLGAFDPSGAFKSADLQIEHLFMPWEGVDLKSLDAADGYARKRGRELLVTVEPWSWDPAQPLAAGELETGIRTGQYDRRIATLCSKLGALKSPTTVRWGHEMDLKNSRYPWADWKPDDYVAAYRRFVDVCRASAPNLSFMWAPRGEHDLVDYYPGDAWVDTIGLSIFGLQAYDNAVFGGERDFAALLAPSYDVAAALKKPIVVSEFGCSGDARYVVRCMDLSAGSLGKFPLLSGIVYFNETEPGEWPAVYGKPDWRMSAGSAARFQVP